jgi:hypothetical protein
MNTNAQRYYYLTMREECILIRIRGSEGNEKEMSHYNAELQKVRGLMDAIRTLFWQKDAGGGCMPTATKLALVSLMLDSALNSSPGLSAVCSNAR